MSQKSTKNSSPSDSKKKKETKKSKLQTPPDLGVYSGAVLCVRKKEDKNNDNDNQNEDENTSSLPIMSETGMQSQALNSEVANSCASGEQSAMSSLTLMLSQEAKSKNGQVERGIYASSCSTKDTADSLINDPADADQGNEENIDQNNDQEIVQDNNVQQNADGQNAILGNVQDESLPQDLQSCTTKDQRVALIRSWIKDGTLCGDFGSCGAQDIAEVIDDVDVANDANDVKVAEDVDNNIGETEEVVFEDDNTDGTAVDRGVFVEEEIADQDVAVQVENTSCPVSSVRDIVEDVDDVELEDNGNVDDDQFADTNADAELGDDQDPNDQCCWDDDGQDIDINEDAEFADDQDPGGCWDDDDQDIDLNDDAECCEDDQDPEGCWDDDGQDIDFDDDLADDQDLGCYDDDDQDADANADDELMEAEDVGCYGDDDQDAVINDDDQDLGCCCDDDQDAELEEADDYEDGNCADQVVNNGRGMAKGPLGPFGTPNTMENDDNLDDDQDDQGNIEQMDENQDNNCEVIDEQEYVNPWGSDEDVVNDDDIDDIDLDADDAGNQCDTGEPNIAITDSDNPPQEDNFQTDDNQPSDPEPISKEVSASQGGFGCEVAEGGTETQGPTTNEDDLSSIGRLTAQAKSCMSSTCNQVRQMTNMDDMTASPAKVAGIVCTIFCITTLIIILIRRSRAKTIVPDEIPGGEYICNCFQKGRGGATDFCGTVQCVWTGVRMCVASAFSAVCGCYVNYFIKVQRQIQEATRRNNMIVLCLLSGAATFLVTMTLVSISAYFNYGCIFPVLRECARNPKFVLYLLIPGCGRNIIQSPCVREVAVSQGPQDIIDVVLALRRQIATVKRSFLCC